MMLDSACDDLYTGLGNTADAVGLICNLLGSTTTVDEEHLKRMVNILRDGPSCRREALLKYLFPYMLRAGLRHWFLEHYNRLTDFHDITTEALGSKVALAKLALLHQNSAFRTSGWDAFLGRRCMLRALLCNSAEVRLRAFNLLIDHPKPTRPFREEELTMVRVFIVTNFCEQSPASRMLWFKDIKRLLCRLRDSARHIEDDEGGHLSGCYVAFHQFLVHFAFWSLSQPTSNFNRRAMALSLIELLIEDSEMRATDACSSLPGTFLEATTERHAALVRVLDDAYQWNQARALKLLVGWRGVAPAQSFFDIDGYVEETLKKLASIQSQIQLAIYYRFQFIGRLFPSHSLSLLGDLLNRCQEICLQLESGDTLTSQTGSSKLYPLLASIEALLISTSEAALGEESQQGEKLHSMVKKLVIPLSFRLSAVISRPLHSSTPEGFVSDELLGHIDEVGISDTLDSTSQLLMVNSWRSHKAISQLLAFAAEALPHPDSLTPILVEKIGDYFWLQLTQCRHCGAFSSAADGFERFCKRLWTIQSSATPAPIAPDQWLRKLIFLDSNNSCSESNSFPNLCATRRSGGLPRLVCSIVCTEPANSALHHFHSTMVALLNSLLHGGHTEIEVHRVNVLKVLFSNVKLSEESECYVERGLLSCLQGCSSMVWAIRNAYCQLFAILVRKVFGVPREPQRTLHVCTKNKLSSLEFFSRYPALHRSIYETLAAFVDSISKRAAFEFHAFPVLTLLTYLKPSAVDEKGAPELNVFAPHILRILFSSRAEKLREVAVVALLAILRDVEMGRVVRWLIAKWSAGAPQLNSNTIQATLAVLCSMQTSGAYSCDLTLNLDAVALLGKLMSVWDFKKLNDFTRFTLLTLVSRIEYAAEMQASALKNFLASLRVIKSNGWECSARPLGELFCQSHAQKYWQSISPIHSDPTHSTNAIHNSELMEEIRCEAYRAIHINGGANTSCDDIILASATADLATCQREKHMKFILLIMVVSADKLRNSMEIATTLRDIVWNRLRKSSNKLNLIKLWLRLDRMSESVEDGRPQEFVAFISAKLRDTDEDVRRNALETAGEWSSLRLYSDKFLPEIALLLKDEVEETREEAARILSSKLTPPGSAFPVEDGLSLNPEVCWSLALQRWPRLADNIRLENQHLLHISEPEEFFLFEACARNSFAEDFPVFEVENFMTDVRTLSEER